VSLQLSEPGGGVFLFVLPTAPTISMRWPGLHAQTSCDPVILEPSYASTSCVLVSMCWVCSIIYWQKLGMLHTTDRGVKHCCCHVQLCCGYMHLCCHAWPSSGSESAAVWKYWLRCNPIIVMCSVMLQHYPVQPQRLQQ
jgi:hypothetical protein